MPAVFVVAFPSFLPADRLHFLHIVDLNIHKDDERPGFEILKSRVSFDHLLISLFKRMFSTDSLIFEGHIMQNLQASFCWAPNFPTAVHQMPPGPLTPLDVCNIGRFVPLLPARFSRFPMWAMASCVEKQEDVLKRPCLFEGLFLFFFLNLLSC